MYIGIDLGTSSVKILLVTKQGEIKKIVNKKYDVLVPKPLWTEQDPNDWYHQTLEGLKEIVKGFETDIKAISFSGQMHGLVLLDHEDQIIRNAILWNDQRTILEVELLNKSVGKKRIIEETGNIAVTGLTAPKVLWVYRNEPNNFKKISKIMLPKDYLVYRLTGSYVSDVSDTSGTLYYDVKRGKYSKIMIEALHLDITKMPRVVESFQVVGLLKKDIKQQLNIQQDVKIIAGGGDQAVGAIGVGVVNDGETNIALGTSGVVFTAMDRFSVDDISNMQSYKHANGKYHMMGVTLNAAGVISWWNEKIFQTNDYKAFYESISNLNKQDNLYFLPYLSGERAPINNPHAQGALIGLRQEHRKEHIGLAILEGISFNIRWLFENIKRQGVNPNVIRVTGGGAKNEFWIQMLSDILNVKVETISSEEGPALGAAILAMVGDGVYEDVSKACEAMVKVKAIFKPNANNVSYYQKKYLNFSKVYQVVNQLYLKEE